MTITFKMSSGFILLQWLTVIAFVLCAAPDIPKYSDLASPLPTLPDFALFPNLSSSLALSHLPQLPPAYMVDNTNNFWGSAPDHGTLNGPVNATHPSTKARVSGISLVKSSSREQFRGRVTELYQLLRSLVAPSAQVKRQNAVYWYDNAEHGVSPYAPAGYPVYRNVMDYGAKGDGITDDTAAINAAIAAGGRCGADCGATSILQAVVYFPPGTYAVSTPIVQYYFTTFLGNPNDRAVIKGLSTFTGIALIDTDVYIPGGGGTQWYTNQNQFYRQIRNMVFDLTEMGNVNYDGDQNYVPTGLHWQVAQGTKLQNLHFEMPFSATTAVGIFTDNGSGGFVSDLTFFGGNIGWRAGSQQFTAHNLAFTHCGTAVSMIWDWGWTWQNITVTDCPMAFDTTSYGGDGGQGTGSLTIIDSTFIDCQIGVTILEPSALDIALTSIILDDLVVQNTPLIVATPNGTTILAGNRTGSIGVVSWGLGVSYMDLSDDGEYTIGDLTNAPHKPSSLLQDGTRFIRSKPEYTSVTTVTSFGAIGDGFFDNTAVLNTALQLTSAAGQVLYFPAGIYAVQGTVFVPTGSRIVGESLPQIMATGQFFGSKATPQVMVRVGNAGDVGIIEISDMLFTVQGTTAGCILMEWNVKEDTQGSAAMWDSYFRVGGAQGSALDASACAKLLPTVNHACIGASLILHLTPESSGYFEAIWAWVADHDIDSGPQQTQIDVYSGRGILIESQGPTWLYGTASEHSALYQYQLSHASNVFLGHMQTETPYYQDFPAPPLPFANQAGFPDDPDFGLCDPDIDPGCAMAWALRLLSSEQIYIYGAGLYSFFNQYTNICAEEFSCQNNLVETSFSTQLWLYNLYTIGSVNSIIPAGADFVVDSASSVAGFTTEINAWLSLTKFGADIGGGTPSNDSGVFIPYPPDRNPSPVNATIVPLSCTTVAPQATFTLTPECASEIAPLQGSSPGVTSQNNPPGPNDCSEICDVFRLLTNTCCGIDGSIGNPIVIPFNVSFPLPIPLPVGYQPNANITIPATYAPFHVTPVETPTTIVTSTTGGSPFTITSEVTLQTTSISTFTTVDSSGQTTIQTSTYIGPVFSTPTGGWITLTSGQPLSFGITIPAWKPIPWPTLGGGGGGPPGPPGPPLPPPTGLIISDMPLPTGDPPTNPAEPCSSVVSFTTSELPSSELSTSTDLSTSTSASSTDASSATSPGPTQTASNSKGSSQCSTLGHSVCPLAWARYVDDKLYTKYTSYTYLNCSAPYNSDFALADGGCTAIFACDNYDGVALTGLQIKSAFDYMHDFDGVGICGSAYFDNGCHITTDYCYGCITTVDDVSYAPDVCERRSKLKDRDVLEVPSPNMSKDLETAIALQRRVPPTVPQASCEPWQVGGDVDGLGVFVGGARINCYFPGGGRSRPYTSTDVSRAVMRAFDLCNLDERPNDWPHHYKNLPLDRPTVPEIPMGQGHFDTRCEDIWQIWFNKLPAKNPWRSPEWKNSPLWEWPIMNDGSLYNPIPDEKPKSDRVIFIPAWFGPWSVLYCGTITHNGLTNNAFQSCYPIQP